VPEVPHDLRRIGYSARMSHDQNKPPSREGLSDAEVWEWTGDHWRVRRIPPFEEPNPGGSPAPVDDP
jgi:hypothetical protein